MPVARLVTTWLPTLDAVVDKLTRGATVADLGPDPGPAIAIAAAFPASTVVGVQPDRRALHAARALARHRGVADRTRFVVGDVAMLAGPGYDLVTSIGVRRPTADTAEVLADDLARDGTWLLVGPLDEHTASEDVSVTSEDVSVTSEEVSATSEPAMDEPALAGIVRPHGFSRWRLAFTDAPWVGYEARI